MIIYVMSSPDDTMLLLTANREIVMGARKIARDANETLEVNSWDTDASPLLHLDLNIQIKDDTIPSHEPTAERLPRALKQADEIVGMSCPDVGQEYDE